MEETKKKAFIEEFIKGNYLIETKDYSHKDRYSRNHLYYRLSGQVPAEVEQLLKNKHVLVLGCGGIGNAISYLLSAAGIGNITLMDHDLIEASNLTRQFLFTEDDIGKNKTTCLEKELKARNKKTNIRTIDTQIHVFEDLYKIPENVDLIVLSADKPHNIVFWINKFCFERNIPYINVGYVEDITVWGPFVIPGKTGCFECQSLVSTPSLPNGMSLQDINKDYQAPSFGPINMLAASLSSLDIIRFLGQFGEIQSLNNRIGLWSHDLKIEKQACNINKNCPRCSNVVERSYR